MLSWRCTYSQCCFSPSGRPRAFPSCCLKLSGSPTCQRKHPLVCQKPALAQRCQPECAEAHCCACREACANGLALLTVLPCPRVEIDSTVLCSSCYWILFAIRSRTTSRRATARGCQACGCLPPTSTTTAPMEEWLCPSLEVGSSSHSCALRVKARPMRGLWTSAFKGC